MLEGVDLTVAESRALVHRIEVAMVSHEEWMAELFRALVCGGELGEEFTAEDAHLRCHFGQWLMSLCRTDPKFNEIPLIQDIDFLHHRMHDAVRILVDYRSGGSEDATVLTGLYDEVVAKRTAFRWLVLTLNHQVCYQILHTDPLTSTYGREKLTTTLQREIAEVCKNPDRESLIVMMDIDYFKKINDTHGHRVGDSVLVEVARFVKANLRPTDLIFRYGGEEFVLLLFGTSLVWAGGLLDRLRSKLSQYEISTSPLKPAISVTASFGVTRIDGNGSIVEQLERADQAMYQAKKQGRNRVIVG